MNETYIGIHYATLWHYPNRGIHYATVWHYPNDSATKLRN